uniref:HK2 n=1 Tax=Arundo donax TaxID=35708 RepID=A0A0A9GDW0_ARUDO
MASQSSSTHRLCSRTLRDPRYLLHRWVRSVRADSFSGSGSGSGSSNRILSSPRKPSPAAASFSSIAARPPLLPRAVPVISPGLTELHRPSRAAAPVVPAAVARAAHAPRGVRVIDGRFDRGDAGRNNKGQRGELINGARRAVAAACRHCWPPIQCPKGANTLLLPPDPSLVSPPILVFFLILAARPSNFQEDAAWLRVAPPGNSKS